MATIGDTIRTQVFAAVRDSTVATAAGVSAVTWASTATTTARVFDNQQTPIGATNRGRLPFVVFYIDTAPYVLDGQGIGDVTSMIRFEINVAGSNRSSAQSQAETIMAAIFAKIRSDNYYFAIGGSALDGFDSTPMWHTLRCSLTVQHTYDPTTF